MTDQLSSDLNVLRVLVLQHQHQQRLKDEASARSDAPAPESTTIPSTTVAAAETTVDKLRPLQQELGTLTEQLHAEKAVSAQLLLQHRCDAASLEELLDQVARLKKQVVDVTSDLAEWKQRCQAAEAAHEGCTSQYESVREQVECVQQRVTETQTQHAALSSALTEAQQLLSKLGNEKAQLMDTLRFRDVELLRLSGIELDRDEALARVQVFEVQHADWMAEVKEYHSYFDSVREEYVRGLNHVIAVRADHDALRMALTQSEARCTQWEQLFEHLSVDVRVGCAAVRTGSATKGTLAHISCAIEGGSGRCSSSVSAANECHVEDALPRNVTFESLLEAKVADLALRLCDAQARAEAAEHIATDLSRLSLADSTLLIYLKSLVCALRPQAEDLAEQNAQLQARLLALESHTGALMQHVVHLGEAFAEEASRRCWLTTAAARDSVAARALTAETSTREIENERVADATSGADIVAAGSGGGRNGGTTHPPATPLSALRPSPRHRLCRTFLRQRDRDD